MGDFTQHLRKRLADGSEGPARPDRYEILVAPLRLRVWSWVNPPSA